MSNRFVSRAVGAAIVAVLLALTASTASAQCAGFSSDLTVANTGLSSFPAPTGSYGTVCVTLNGTGTQATISYTAAAGFGFIDGGSVDANVSGTFTAGSVSGNSPNNSYTLTANGGCPPPVDGIGCYNAIVDSPTSSPGDTSTFITFTLNGNWADFNSVLTANKLGYDAGAHITVNGSDCGGSPCTGFAAETAGTSTVPEPTSIALLGGVLLFATNRLRKRFVS